MTFALSEHCLFPAARHPLTPFSWALVGETHSATQQTTCPRKAHRTANVCECPRMPTNAHECPSQRRANAPRMPFAPTSSVTGSACSGSLCALPLRRRSNNVQLLVLAQACLVDLLLALLPLVWPSVHQGDRCATYVNENYDVEGLCRELPERLQELHRHGGDRLAK